MAIYGYIFVYIALYCCIHSRHVFWTSGLVPLTSGLVFGAWTCFLGARTSFLVSGLVFLYVCILAGPWDPSPTTPT